TTRTEAPSIESRVRQELPIFTASSAQPYALESGRHDDAPVRRDDGRVIPGLVREQRQAPGTEHPERGRTGVGDAEICSDDGRGHESGRRSSISRIKDVIPSLVPPGGRAREIPQPENHGDALAFPRMGDADAPRTLVVGGVRAAAHDDVAACTGR